MLNPGAFEIDEKIGNAKKVMKWRKGKFRFHQLRRVSLEIGSEIRRSVYR